jgi:transposase
MTSYGRVEKVGVEQTGSYGAGVVRALGLEGIPVLEVTGPDKADRRARQGRPARRRRGGAGGAQRQADPAGQAPRRAHRGAARAQDHAPNGGQGAPRGAAAAAQHDRCRPGQDPRPAPWQHAHAADPRPGASLADPLAFRDPDSATQIALRSLARILEVDDEIADLDELIAPLVKDLAPDMLERVGFGIEVTGQLLVTAGDNPDRLASEAAWAMLCGSSRLPASSGKTRRHRLNRGGDRDANSALHMAAICRLRLDPRTKAYAARRQAEGLSKRETLRCLKRYLARESYHLLT